MSKEPVDCRDIYQSNYFYDLVTKNADGKWVRMHVGDTYGHFSHQSIVDEADAREMLELYYIGRANWDIRIVRLCETLEVDEVP